MKRLLTIAICMLLAVVAAHAKYVPNTKRTSPKAPSTLPTTRRARDCSTYTSPAMCFTMWARTVRCMPTTTIA